MVIYADVLICVNFIVDYLLIGLTTGLLKTQCLFWRQLVGAVVGGLCSLFILLPVNGIVWGLILRLSTSFLVVAVTYGLGSVGQFIRRLSCFFSVSFTFFGGMFALWHFIKPPGLLVKNGIVYYNLSSVVIVVSAAISYGIITVIGRFIGRKSTELCKLRVVTEQGQANVMALVDSGNKLKEPFSEKPVILLDQAYESLFEGIEHKRVIPYSTVSGQGTLMGIYPKEVSLVTAGGTERLDVYLALSPLPLKEYGAIIGKDAI